MVSVIYNTDGVAPRTCAVHSGLNTVLKPSGAGLCLVVQQKGPRRGPALTSPTCAARPRGFSTSGVPRHVMPRRASNQIFAHTVLLAHKVAQQLWRVRLLRYQQLFHYTPGLIDSYFDLQMMMKRGLNSSQAELYIVCMCPIQKFQISNLLQMGNYTSVVKLYK